ncbi:MAG: META domain-containing protein [Flavitalea sp.]
MKQFSILFSSLIIIFFMSGCHSPKPAVEGTENASLSGYWQLNYISGRRIAFEGLYPDKRPEISFDFSRDEINGYTTCNPFSSKFTMEVNKISISAPNASTMSACEGEGEKAFLDMLQKVNKYTVQDSVLNFLIDDVAVMRFAKK